MRPLAASTVATCLLLFTAVKQSSERVGSASGGTSASTNNSGDAFLFCAFSRLIDGTGDIMFSI